MSNPSPSLESLTGSELLSATRALVRKSHCVEADLLVHLGEVDERQLYLDCARPSMFSFCVDELGFSEDAAYNRIFVARAGRKLPAIIEAARAGRVHLAGLRLLAPHLTAANQEAVLAEATGKSKRDIELIVARLAPLPPVPATIRKLPECPIVSSSLLLRSQSPIAPVAPQGCPAVPPQGAAGAPSMTSRVSVFSKEAVWEVGKNGPIPEPTPEVAQMLAARSGIPIPDPHRAQVTPLSEDRFKVQFTASGSFRDKLREAQDLLRHRLPDGDMAAIFEQGLDLLIAKVKKERFAVGRKQRAKTAEPPPPPPAVAPPARTVGESGEKVASPPSRHIPDAIKRFVYERDGGRCTFVDAEGRRCSAKTFLQFDHMDGFARTQEHDRDRIRLLCAAHNQQAADKLYGRDFMDRARSGEGKPELVPGQVAPPVATAGTTAAPQASELVPGQVEPAVATPGRTAVPQPSELVPGQVQPPTGGGTEASGPLSIPWPPER